MRLLALVPARGGSKGVPRKNVRLLGGKPLVAWTIETALACGDLFADVLVSTEDEEIAAIARTHGASVPFLRSAAAASDTAKSITVVREVLRMQVERGYEYDGVCLLQPTVPFRKVTHLRAAARTFTEGDFTGLVSVQRVPDHHHPHWTFLAENGQLRPAVAELPTRRQDLPPAYIRDGSLYFTRTETLLADGFYGPRLGYWENPHPARINIDTMDDWRAAEAWVAQSGDGDV